MTKKSKGSTSNQKQAIASTLASILPPPPPSAPLNPSTTASLNLSPIPATPPIPSTSEAASGFSPVPIFLHQATDTHNALKQQLLKAFDLPPYASLPSTISINDVKIETARVKDLNIQDSYARDKPLSVKEHIQNWRDQCVVVGKRINPSFTSMSDLKPKVFTHKLWKFYVYIYQNQTLGWIAWRPIMIASMLKGSTTTTTTKSTEQRIHLELFNAATSIYADEVLVMGRSSKTDTKATQDAAGYFGEGVKVEINRLLSSSPGEVTIKYHTSGSMWEFGYSDRGVLLAKISSSSSATASSTTSSSAITGVFPHTWIELHNIPISTFDPFEYLFIAPPEMVISSKSDPYGVNGKGGVQIVLDKAYHGRVYLHGIFVMDTRMLDKRKLSSSTSTASTITSATASATKAGSTIITNDSDNYITPMCFAWNYCGSTANFQELRVRRDRDDLNLAPLMKAMMYLIHDLRMSASAKPTTTVTTATALPTTASYEDQVNAVIESLYETLENLSNNQFKPEFSYWPHATVFRHSNLYYLVDTVTWKSTATLLLQRFMSLHGANAIPQNRGGTNWWSMKILPLTREEREQITREAELLGVQFVHISEILYEWLVKAEECPTLEKFWNKRGQEVLALPEYVYDLEHDPLPYDSNHSTTAASTNTTSSLSSPVMVKEKLLFPSEEQIQSVKSIREQISAYFYDDRESINNSNKLSLSYGNRVRFKDFSKMKNTRRMIHLQPIPDVTHCDYYIVDLKWLTSDHVHAALKKLDDDFVCPALVFADLLPSVSSASSTSNTTTSSPNVIKCGCVQNLLIEDILKCWPAEQKSKYDAKFRRRFLSSMPTSIDMDFGNQSNNDSNEFEEEEKKIKEEEEEEKLKKQKEAEALEAEVAKKAEEEKKSKDLDHQADKTNNPEELKVDGKKDSEDVKESSQPTEEITSPVEASSTTTEASVNDEDVIVVSMDDMTIEDTEDNGDDKTDATDENFVDETNAPNAVVAVASQSTPPAVTASNAHATATSFAPAANPATGSQAQAQAQANNNNQTGKATNQPQAPVQAQGQAQAQESQSNQPQQGVIIKKNKSGKSIDRTILSTIATVPRSIAERCMNYASSSPVIESEFMAVAKGDQTIVIEGNNSNDECDAISGNFRQLKVTHIQGVKYQLPIKIFIHENSISEIVDYQTLAQSEKMKQFAVLLALLLGRVFHYDLEHVAIYMAATNTMAFNRRGNLFFNFLMMDSYINRHPLEACNLLYSVTCHELAHNIVKEHNDEFASTMGDLVVNYMTDFVALTKRLQVTFTTVKGNDVAKMWRLIGGSGSSR